VAPIPDVDEGHHFAGFNTRLLLEYLVEAVGRPVADEVLAAAGEERPWEVLTDDSSWSSYDQFRALLEATAARVGEAGLRALATTSSLDARWTSEGVHVIQALGSCQTLFREAAASGTGLGVSTLVAVDGLEEPAEGVLVVSSHFREGFAPFKAWCWYYQALTSLVPRLFGLDLAVVHEEACQCDGATRCRMRIELPRPEETEPSLEQQLESARVHIEALEARLESIQDTVAELVAAGDVDQTLLAIAKRAARAVRVPAHLLLLPGQRIAPEVLASGIEQGRMEAAIAHLRDLAELGEEVPGVLRVPVTSGRTHYGWLALVEPGRRFRPYERATAESYARLAAAALDNAAALSEARRQAATANALLELSTALGGAMTEREVASHLARTIPAVVDCDRALVVLTGADGCTRIEACHGCPTATARQLVGRRIALGVGQQANRISFIDTEEPLSDRSMATLVRWTGSIAAISAPIEVEGEAVGFLVGAVTERPERLSLDPGLEERLVGLAGQATAAIHNSRLLGAIRHQALHDALTGLPNRALILDRAQHLLRRARRRAGRVTVLFVDLDGFKDVNDELGHVAGDELLRSAAERLSRSVRDADTVGRLGGDEFVVLLESTEPGSEPELVARRILEAFGEPFELSEAAGRRVEVTASIGVASGRPMDVDELLRNADIALYQAKSGGRNRMVEFDPEMGAAAQDRRELEGDLLHALHRQELFLLYQPLFNLKSVEMIGVEALLRWRHPGRGVLTPDQFLGLLESTGLIVPVGRFVLETACAQAAAWRVGGHLLDMSVNVSWRQIETATFVDDLAGTLDRTGLAPSALVLEVTESAIMRDATRASERLGEVRALGVRIAIDDFGAGYSSMSRLRSLPVDALKIDREFVTGIAGSVESQALVHNFVQLARTFGLETFAEGIEDQGQLARLRDEDCQSGQGFLLARPTDAAGIERLLAGLRAPSSAPS
jgi:diguanylate cyclase (GGDEF)-like protein